MAKHEELGHLSLDQGIKAMGLANKINNTEGRGHVRHNCEAIIEWSYFNQEIYFDAKLLNFSESGVYFETGHDLKPGATIFLKMTMVSTNKFNSLDQERPRSVSLGEVKWRIDLSASDKTNYGVGVRYPFPA
ncbi:MAG: PilZ domain-containing protein [Deltaproteobacteria bacterium]|nr:PilZ domain-containing protein [Deltaproteobacteria bacterium]